MPINSFLYPGAKVTTGYDVDNSLRFNRASSDNLSATLATDNGDVHKWTYSFWFKRSTLGSDQQITSAHYSGSYAGGIVFRSTDQFEIFDYRNNSFSLQKKTNRLFRDVSAWYHIVISNDNSVSSPDLKIYVNGVEETSFATDNEYSQNEDNSFNNSAYTNRIGAGGVNNDYIGGYLSEFCFIDGTALDATSFGEFDEDSGIWKPIDVSGLTFGTNGFYLDFEDSSALGNDVSGNDNDFTVNNLTSIDQSTDTCTNNFSTMNPLDQNGGMTFSDGNLSVASTSASWRSTRGTFGVTQGKWYYEVKPVNTSGSLLDMIIGWGDFEIAIPSEFSSSSPALTYTAGSGNKQLDGVNSSYGATYNVNDIIGVAFDADNLTVEYFKNGTSQGSISTGWSSGITWTPIISLYGRYNNTKASFNFGSPPYSISSGNSDANGYGNFEYSVPSGYYALNTKNLSEFG